MSDAKVKVLITKEKIAERVASLANEISTAHQGESLVIIGLLNGSIVFTADLMRALSGRGFNAEVDFMVVESYAGGTKSSGQLNIIQDVRTKLEGKTVLLVDDIIDTGLTARQVALSLSAKNPNRVVTVALLDKSSGRTVDFSPDYVGFTIENHFVVGYGLDARGSFRCLPYIGYLEE